VLRLHEQEEVGGCYPKFKTVVRGFHWVYGLIDGPQKYQSRRRFIKPQTGCWTGARKSTMELTRSVGGRNRGPWLSGLRFGQHGAA
jgi:hypothetical protein